MWKNDAVNVSFGRVAFVSLFIARATLSRHSSVACAPFIVAYDYKRKQNQPSLDSRVNACSFKAWGHKIKTLHQFEMHVYNGESYYDSKENTAVPVIDCQGEGVLIEISVVIFRK